MVNWGVYVRYRQIIILIILWFGSLGFVVYELDMVHEAPPHLCFAHNLFYFSILPRALKAMNPLSPLLRRVIYYPNWVVIKTQRPQLGLAPCPGSAETGSLNKLKSLTSCVDTHLVAPADETNPTVVRLVSRPQLVSPSKQTVSQQALESTRWQNLSRNS